MKAVFGVVAGGLFAVTGLLAYSAFSQPFSDAVEAGGASFEDSAGLADLLDDETGSGALNFGLEIKTATITLNKDGAGADCAIVGTGAGALGHAEGCELVAAVAGKFAHPLQWYMTHDFVTAAYTGGSSLLTRYNDIAADIMVPVAAGAALTAAEDRYVLAVRDDQTIVLTASPVGAALQLSAASAFTNPGTAAGTATIVVQYILIP